MEVFSGTDQSFPFPRELVKTHYDLPTPSDFQIGNAPLNPSWEGGFSARKPSFYTAHFPQILERFYAKEKQNILKENTCDAPLLLYDKMLSFEKLLFHYEGNPQSAQLIRGFLELFKLNIGDSSATIISPSFIPKSRMKEEQELIELITKATADTSFIKFNFKKLEQFCSYAVKHDHTMLVTAKRYQEELASLLLHSYPRSSMEGQLSYYLAT